VSNVVERRAFLQSAISVPLALGLGRFAANGFSADAPPSPEKSSSGLIVRQSPPLNLEMPMSDLTDFITPNEKFFVRNHFDVPTLDPKTWRLSIEGQVDSRTDLTFDELLKMPNRTVAATLECSGNGRGLLEPKKTGVQWLQGAVGNAQWTGVPLAAVLERAKIKANSVDIVLVGADTGETKEGQKTQFLRSLPLKKAKDPNVLLAYQMNHGSLPANHGFPLRAVVPGWFGVASVKWLTRILVTDRPFQAYFQSLDYAVWQRDGGLAHLTPITSLLVKSIISRPQAGDEVGADQDLLIAGAAWTGEGEITKVEVSTDDGRTWGKATLLGSAAPNAWRLWQFPWRTPRTAGKISLMSRATDSAGNVQPAKRNDDRRNYLINHLIPVEITVR
jgi:DMSO/TMAO reductase YedYZ molybdopterin-dependent catalytic subunit